MKYTSDCYAPLPGLAVPRTADIPIIGALVAYGQRILNNIMESVWGERITIQRRKEALDDVRKARGNEQKALRKAEELETKYIALSTQYSTAQQQLANLEKRVIGGPTVIGGEFTTLESLYRDNIGSLSFQVSLLTKQKTQIEAEKNIYRENTDTLNTQLSSYRSSIDSLNSQVTLITNQKAEIEAQKTQIEKAHSKAREIVTKYKEVTSFQKELRLWERNLALTYEVKFSLLEYDIAKLDAIKLGLLTETEVQKLDEISQRQNIFQIELKNSEEAKDAAYKRTLAKPKKR